MKRTIFSTVFIVSIIILISGFFSACHKKQDDPTAPAEGRIKLEDSSISYLKKAILNPAEIKTNPTESPIEDEDLLEALMEDINGANPASKPVENAVISKVVELAVIKEAEVQSDGTMTVTVVAPDMSKLFNELLDKEYTEPLSADEMESYFLKAIKDKKNLKEFAVNVPMVEVEGEFIPDPSDEDFKNAMTGGFRDAFMEFYNKSLEEIFKQLSESNAE